MGERIQIQRRKHDAAASVTPDAPLPERPLLPPASAALPLDQAERFGHSFARIALTDPSTPARSPENRTGLPDRLRAGVEALSGVSLEAVRVHYNSSRPANVQALAYTQGRDIHVGPGQEKHLPQETWHVVQQEQGRVEPTARLRGSAINDDPALESEAVAMGAKADGANIAARAHSPVRQTPALRTTPIIQGAWVWIYGDNSRKYNMTDNGDGTFTYKLTGEIYEQAGVGSDGAIAVRKAATKKRGRTFENPSGEKEKKKQRRDDQKVPLHTLLNLAEEMPSENSENSEDSDYGSDEDLSEDVSDAEREKDEKGFNLDLSNTNFRALASNVEKYGQGSATSKKSAQEVKEEQEGKTEALSELMDIVHPTFGHFEEISAPEKFIPEMKKRGPKGGGHEYHKGPHMHSGTYNENYPYFWDPGVIHRPPKLKVIERDKKNQKKWNTRDYKNSIPFGKEADGLLGTDKRPQTARPNTFLDFQVPEGRYYFRPSEKEYLEKSATKEYAEHHKNLEHRNFQYRKLSYLMVHTSPKISTINKQVRDIHEAAKALGDQGNNVVTQGDFYAEQKAKKHFQELEKSDRFTLATPDAEWTNFPGYSKGKPKQGQLADMGYLDSEAFDLDTTLALPPPGKSVSPDDFAKFAAVKSAPKNRTVKKGEADESRGKERRSLEDFVGEDKKFSKREYEHWLDLSIDHTPTVISASFNRENDYQPSQQQLQAIGGENNLVWVKPDGYCIFGAVGAATGNDAGGIYSEVLARLEKAVNDSRDKLHPLLAKFGVTAEEMLWTVKGISTLWGSDDADHLLELVLTIIGQGVTVVHADGRQQQFRGGGNKILRVTHPFAHYHASKPG